MVRNAIARRLFVPEETHGGLKMKTSAARRILAAVLLAGISPAAAHAAGEIKGGK